MTENNVYPLPFVKQGKYVILDTTLKSQDAMPFDELSGDYGDAGRMVYLAIKDRAVSNDPKTPLIPMDLTGKDIRLQGHDAQGVFKRISLATRIIDAKAGLAEMTIPRNFYEAVGPYENAEFEVFGSDDNSRISTIPVGFEVYNNHAHMIVGESKPYIDEVDKLLTDIRNNANKNLDDVTERLGTLTRSLTDANAGIATLKTLLATWQNLVSSNAVGVLSEDNIWSGKNIFINPIDALAKGTTINSYFASSPQQDLNSVDDLQGMPTYSTRVNYYSANHVLNNPSPTDYLIVETRRVSPATIVQVAQTNNSKTTGTILRRYIGSVNTTPVFGKWYVVERWSDWINLPLAPGIVPRYADKAIPQYRFNGSRIEIRGKFATTKKHKLKAGTDRINISTKLPASVKTGQYVPATWSKAIPYTLRVEEDVLFMERIYNNDGSPANIDVTHLFALGNGFALA